MCFYFFLWNPYMVSWNKTITTEERAWKDRENRPEPVLKKKKRVFWLWPSFARAGCLWFAFLFIVLFLIFLSQNIALGICWGVKRWTNVTFMYEEKLEFMQAQTGNFFPTHLLAALWIAWEILFAQGDEIKLICHPRLCTGPGIRALCGFTETQTTDWELLLVWTFSSDLIWLSQVELACVWG